MEEYNNYFKIPGYYTKITSNIHSEHLLPIFTENPIEYLRGLYSNDNEQFYNVRDELILRGVGFQLNYQNDYLLDQQYNIEYIISKKYNTNAFKDINFSLIGASNLTERFNIKSDRFFHGVPLEGVLYFTRGISTIVLQDMFKMAGFSIIPVQDFVFQQKNEENEEHTKEKSTHYAINQESSILNNPPPQNTTIDYLFDGTDYKTFRIYCKENNIKYFYQLNIDFIRNFEHQIDISKNTIEKTLALHEEISFRFLDMPIEIEKTMDLLLDNPFKELMEKTNKNYLGFINEFYSTSTDSLHSNELPYEKIFRLNEEIVNIYLIFSMPAQVEEMINILIDNPFKKLMENNDMNYTAFINDFYLTRPDRTYSDEFPFEEVENIDKYIMENKEKRKKEKFKELISSIKEHYSFTYAENLSLLQIKEMIAPSIKLEDNKDMLLLECFNDIEYSDMLKNIYKQLDKVQPISIILDDVMDQFKPRNIIAFDLRQTKTLEEIGEVIGVTRERVRQIVSQMTKKIARYKGKIYLDLYIHYYSMEKNKVLSVNEFMKFYNLENSVYKALLHSFFEMDEELTYVDELDLYIETHEYMYVTEVLHEIGFESLETAVIDVTDIKDFFSPATEQSYMKAVGLLFEGKGYQKVNMIYVYKRINIIKRINYLFEHVIRGPLEMDDEGYIYFKKLMESTFNLPFESSKRAATSRVADGEDVILVDRNTFAYHQKEVITNEFLYKLEIIIDEKLESNSYVDPRNVFVKYRKLMEDAQLISPTHLYSIVQIYLDEKYETGHGSSLHIFKEETGRRDAESILLDYLFDHGHEVNRNAVIKELNWKEYKLDQLLGRIKTVLLIGDSILKTVESFDFQQDDMSMLTNEVNSLMQDGYIFIYDLQFELGFNQQFEPMIKKYSLSNETTLVAILKWLLPDLQGHSKLLYWKDTPVNKLEDVIVYEYPDILTRQELVQFIDDKGYSDQTLGHVAVRIFEEKLFYYYTTTQYINSKQLHFSDQVKESLNTYLTNELKENDYMSVYNMTGFTINVLPVSEYQWTEWLIYQFAKYIGYQQVTFSNDYRYEKLILVKNVMNIDSYDNLILHIVKTEYDGRYHEEDLARFLEAKLLLNNPRKLPIGIHQSPYFKFDSFGFFEVRSCDDVIN